MKNLDKILSFAEKISLESDEMINKNDKWIEYFSPVYFKKYGKKYEYQYDSMRDKKTKNFISDEYNKFNEIYKK